MIRKVDHIGIAVQDLDQAIAVYRDALGMKLLSVEDVPDQRVRVAKFDAGGDTIELFQPIAEDSPVRGFLEKRGPGLHHVCVQVTDLDAMLETLKRRGIALIDEVPRTGAGGARIAFVHPKSTAGVLIELSEGGAHGV